MSSNGHGLRLSGDSRTDEQLISAYCRGDERAFDQIHSRYYERLLAYVSRFVSDQADCEDIVQETFFRVYRHAKNFVQRYKFSTWICEIAKNLAFNYLRALKRRKRFLVSPNTCSDMLAELEYSERGLVAAASDKKPSPLELVIFSEMTARVERFLDTLPKSRRTVVMLRAEGGSYRQIAKITRQNQGTVRSQLHRGREALAKELSWKPPRKRPRKRSRRAS